MITPDQLRAARGRLGLTQAQAAEIVGVASKTYEGWEQGKPLSMMSIRVASRALGIASDVVVGSSGKRPPGRPRKNS